MLALSANSGLPTPFDCGRICQGDVIAGKIANVESYRWVVLGTAAVVQIALSSASQSIPPVGPFIIDELKISRAEMGLFVSTEHVGALLVVVLAGWLADVGGFRRTLLGGLAVMGVFMGALAFLDVFTDVFTGALPFMDTYKTALVLVFFAGIGAGATSPSAIKGVMMWFQGKHLATAMSIKQAGTTLGGMLAAVLLPAVALAFNWRISLALVGVSAITAATIAYFFFKEYPRESTLRKPPAKNPGNVLRVLLGKDMLLTHMMGLLFVAIQQSFTAYLTLYVTETFYISEGVKYPKEWAGLFLFFAFAGGLLGRIGWGLVSDRLLRGKRKGILLVASVLGVLLAAALAVIPATTPSVVVALLALLVGFVIVGWNGVYMAFLTEQAGRDLAGTMAGFNQMAIRAGAIVAPPIFGYIVDVTGNYSLAWGYLAVLGIVEVGIIAAVREARGQRTDAGPQRTGPGHAHGP